MSEQEAKARAKLDDLLKGTSGTKTISLKSQDGKTVVIRKLTSGDLATVTRVGKGGDLDKALMMIVKGMVDPKIGKDQVYALPPNVALEISTAIAEFSGLIGEEDEDIKNL